MTENQKIADKKYRESHREQIRARVKKYKQTHCKETIAACVKYNQAHPEKHRQYDKKYSETHREQKRAYERNRRKNDPAFRLLYNARAKLAGALNGTTKSAHTTELLGCTARELKTHLENQFTEGMTWDNYGKWEVDHIYPCSKFDLTKPEEQQRCFHFTNLQPLWENDNLKKSNKVEQVNT